MMPPEVFTTVLWQGLQAVAGADLETEVWTASFGAAPWQEPQVALVAVFQVQVRMEPFWLAASDAPWQYVVQVSAVGGVPWTTLAVTPPKLARADEANVTSEIPLVWLEVKLFTAMPWHSEQSTGVMTCVAGVGTACDTCPPTRTPVEAPAMSFGGMAMRLFELTCDGPKVPAVWTRPAVPWQPEQDMFGGSKVPFMWMVLLVVQPGRFPAVQL
jgi:hypothetical protein